MIILIYKRNALTDQTQIDRFEGLYSTFFEDFHSHGISCWLFYVLYITRRIILVFSINLIENAVLQVALSLMSSLFVGFISVSMYVLAVRPFKLWFVNMYHIVNEASIAVFYFCILILIMPRSILSWEYVSTLCTYIIMFTWALNVITVFSVTLVKGVKKLRECIRKKRSARVLPVNSGKETKRVIFTEVHKITTKPDHKRHVSLSDE